jgi:outer membrane protein OmpA-like peptidoglycan-associated protein
VPTESTGRLVFPPPALARAPTQETGDSILRSRINLSFFGALAALLIIAAPAQAQGEATDAYALDTGGKIVRSGFGECVRTSAWTAAKAIAACDPDLVKKPAPKPVAAAPAPTPAPAPVARAADTDGDGVIDTLDRCPGTPAGARVDANGCELDSDGDGVVDRLDRCPGTARGAKVDAKGCELDSDGDGVVDRLDRCPGTKAGAKVDASGCEIPEVISLKDVNFATNSATLTGASSATLDEAAATLIKRGNVRVEVAGHTDSRGSAKRNRVLSQQRAEAVMRYLVSKGVNPANLTARGYGPDQPDADNKTEAGRAANRRVELRVQQQ